MKCSCMLRLQLASAVIALLCAARCLADEKSGEIHPPKVGDTVADFQFSTIEGKDAKLSEAAGKGPVVLIVLRGFPGYQCPICTKQVADLRKHAKDFQDAGASVVLVYSGTAKNLEKHAKEF